MSHSAVPEIDLARFLVAGATFEDGYRSAVVSGAILESARSGRAVPVEY